MEVTLELNTYIILFIAAFLASLIDSIAGGGGLLTTPAMLLVGINPLNTLATNKFQSCFGTLTSTYNYYKNGLLTEPKRYLFFFLSFAGSMVGTFLVSRISNEVLESIIPILLISAAVFFILNRGHAPLRPKAARRLRRSGQRNGGSVRPRPHQRRR